MSHLRKRAQSGYYKDVQQYRDDWRLMFNNARTYNQEGSWVYVDAEEMEKVFEEVFTRETRGSGLPGAEDAIGSGVSSHSSPMEEDRDNKPTPPTRGRGGGRGSAKQVLSDDEYLTPSEDD